MESKYRHLRNELSRKIEMKEYPPGSKLPPEGELMEQYDCSRDTVRKALELLVRDGDIQKTRGRAAEVLDRRSISFPVTEITSFKELAALSNQKAKTYVENLDIIKNHKDITYRLNLKENEEAFRLVRVREIEGEKIILDKDYFSRKIVENLPLKAAQDSVYEYLEKELGIRIGHAVKEITVQRVTEEDKQLLDLDGYDMVAVVRSYTYLADSTLFQFTEARHRPDKFRFVDFGKRSY